MKLLVALCFSLYSLSCFGQVSKGIEAIDSLVAVARVSFLASDEFKGRLTGTKEAKLAAKFIENELRRAGLAPIVDTFTAKGISMQNVYAVVEGENRDQFIIVGAHYDHLGVDSTGDAFNGADDNASGVAAVLGIADAIKASGLKPKKSIILGLWDGEECGLNGSKRFVNNFDRIEDVLFYLNFDMIGRNNNENKPKEFRYFYTAKNDEFKQFLDEAINEFGLKLEPDYRPWDDPTSGSDNASFARVGIPIVWYHTDSHPDFHNVGDTTDKLNWPKMLDIIKSSYLVVWRVANQ